MREIGSEAFCYCRRLGEVTFKEGSLLKTIGMDTFYECSALAKITLSDGLETIGEKCFFEIGLKEILIPSSVTTIEGNAFDMCGSLKAVLF